MGVVTTLSGHSGNVLKRRCSRTTGIAALRPSLETLLVQ